MKATVAAVSMGALALLAACGTTPPLVVSSTVTVTQVATAEPSATGEEPTPSTWPETLDLVEDGVVLVTTTSCVDGKGYAGTGSLLADDLVLTAAHVVDDAETVKVRGGNGDLVGTVVAYDGTHDLALVRTSAPIGGHVFELARDAPALGTPVAAIGYPLGDDLTINDGIVSSLQSSTTDGDVRLVERLVVSAAINPGNSGGPVVTQDGVEVGVAVSVQIDPETGEQRENRTFAVSSMRVRILVEEEGASYAEVPIPGCPQPEDEGKNEPWEGNWDVNPLFVSTQSGDPMAQQLLNVVANHGYAINQREWTTAYDLFSPGAQARQGSLDNWSLGLASTIWVTLDALDIGTDANGPTLTVALQTRQDPSQAAGMACTDRKLTYHLVADASGRSWLIDRVTQDEPPVACDAS